jgi:hypothetical protein
VPPTHHTHPDYLKNRPPPTVTFDLNVTVASAIPTTPMDPRTTGNMPIQHPPPAGTTPVQQPPSASTNSNMNPSVGIPNLVQPFMHTISRAVVQVLSLLRFGTPALSHATSVPGNYQAFTNPAMHQTPFNPCSAPAHPIPQSFSQTVRLGDPGLVGRASRVSKWSGVVSSAASTSSPTTRGGGGALPGLWPPPLGLSGGPDPPGGPPPPPSNPPGGKP